MKELHTRSWIPDGPVRAHLLLVHGFGEHSGRYDRLARAFGAIGFQVHAYDQRGHGQSPGRRGYIQNFDELVDDLAVQFGAVCEVAGAKPVFLFAHSMGGLVAAHWLARNSAPVAGVVLSSPLLAIPDTVSPLLLRLAGVLGALTPWLPVDRLDSCAISRIEAEVAAYDNDPLNYHGPINARTGAQLSAAIVDITTKFSAITPPILVIHGTGDKMVPPAGSRRLYEEGGSGDKTGNFYEGGYHELFNDSDRERVERDVIAWLSER